MTRTNRPTTNVDASEGSHPCHSVLGLVEYDAMRCDLPSANRTHSVRNRDWQLNCIGSSSVHQLLLLLLLVHPAQHPVTIIGCSHPVNHKSTTAEYDEPLVKSRRSSPAVALSVSSRLISCDRKRSVPREEEEGAGMGSSGAVSGCHSDFLAKRLTWQITWH